MSNTNKTDGSLLGINPEKTQTHTTQGGSVTTTATTATTATTDVGNPGQEGGGSPNFEGTGDVDTQQSAGSTQSGDFTISSDSISDDSYTEVNADTQTQPTGDVRTKVLFDYEINANHFNTGDQVNVKFTPSSTVYNSSNVLLTLEDKQQLLGLGYDIEYDYTYQDINYGSSTFRDYTVTTVNKPDPILETRKPCQTGVDPSQSLITEQLSLVEGGQIAEMSSRAYLKSKILDGSIDIFRDIKWTPGYDMIGYVLDKWSDIFDFINQDVTQQDIDVIINQIGSGFEIVSRGLPTQHQTVGQWKHRALNSQAEDNDAKETVRSSSYNVDSIKFYLMLYLDEEGPIQKLISQSSNIPVSSDTTYEDIMTTAGENTNHDLYYYYLSKLQVANLLLPEKFTNEPVGIRAYWDVLNLFVGQHITIGSELIMAPFYCETTSPHQIFIQRLEESDVDLYSIESGRLYGSINSMDDVDNVYGLKKYGGAYNNDFGIGPSFKLLLANPKIWSPTNNPYNGKDAVDYISADSNAPTGKNRLYEWMNDNFSPNALPVSYVNKSAAENSGFWNQLSEIDRDVLGGFEDGSSYFFRTSTNFTLDTPSNQLLYQVASTVTNQTVNVYPDNSIDTLLYPSDFYFIRQHPGYVEAGQDGPMMVPTINGGPIHYGTNYVRKENLFNLKNVRYATEILPFQEVKPFVGTYDTFFGYNRQNNNIEFPLPGVVGINSSTTVPAFHKKISYEYASNSSYSTQLNLIASQHSWVAKSGNSDGVIRFTSFQKEISAYETISDAWQVIWQHYLDNYDSTSLTITVTLNGNVIPNILIGPTGFSFPYDEPGNLEFKVEQLVDIEGTDDQVMLTLLHDQMELTSNAVTFQTQDVPMLSADSISKDFAINLYGGSFRFKLNSSLDQQNSTDESDDFFQRTIPNLLNDHISHGYVPSILEYPININWMTQNGLDFNYSNISRNCFIKTSTQSSEGDPDVKVYPIQDSVIDDGLYCEMPMLLDPTRFNDFYSTTRANPGTKIFPKQFFDGTTENKEQIQHRRLTTNEHVVADATKREYFVVLFNTDYIPEDGETYTFSSKITLSDGFKVVGGVRRSRTVDDTFNLYEPSTPEVDGISAGSVDFDGILNDTELTPSETTPFRLNKKSALNNFQHEYKHDGNLTQAVRAWDSFPFRDKHFLDNMDHNQAHRHIQDHVEHFNLWHTSIDGDRPVGLDTRAGATAGEYIQFVEQIIEENLLSPSKVVDGTLGYGDEYSSSEPPSDFVYFTYTHSDKAVVNDTGTYVKDRYLAGGLQLAFIIYRDVETLGRDISNYDPMKFNIIEPKLTTQDQYRDQPDVPRIGPTVFSDREGYNSNFGGWLPQTGVQADYGVRYTFRLRRHPDGEDQQNLKTYGTYGDISVPPYGNHPWRSPNRTSTKGVLDFRTTGVDYNFEENSDEYILQTTVVDTYRNLYIVNQPFTVSDIIKAQRSVEGQYSPFQGIDIPTSLIPEVPYTVDWESENDEDERPNLGVYYYADDWTEDIGALLAGSLQNYAITEEDENGQPRVVDNVFTQSAASLLDGKASMPEVVVYQNCNNYQASGQQVEGYLSTNIDYVTSILDEAEEEVQRGNGDNIADIFYPAFALGQGCGPGNPSYCESVNSYITYYQTNNTNPEWKVVNENWYSQVQQPDNQCRNKAGYPVGQTGPDGDLFFGSSNYVTNWVPDIDVRPVENLASGAVNATLFNYYDKDLQSTRFELSSAPTTVAMLIYKRSANGSVDQTMSIPYDALDSYEVFSEAFPTYIVNIDWGDGTTDPDQTYTNEPLLLSKNTVLTHTYTKPGVHVVKFLMMDVVKNVDSVVSSNFPNNAILGYVNYWYVTARFNLSENPENESSYIVNQKPTLVVSGVSKDSVYAKSLRNFIGYTENSNTFQGFPLQFQYDVLHTNVAASTVDELYFNSDVINPWTGSVVDRRVDELIHNGAYTNLNSLGDYIGDSDLATVRVYNKPKKLWTQLGFESSRISDVGDPASFYYWKNIIPKEFNIYDRDGVEIEDTSISIDTDSEQNWMGGYAYPSLPKVNDQGQFDLEGGYQSNTIFYGAKTAWDSYDISASISNNTVRDESLIIDLDFSEIDENTLRDGSGNLNKGTLVSDYKLNYDRNEKSIIRNDNLFIPNRGTQNDGPY